MDKQKYNIRSLPELKQLVGPMDETETKKLGVRGVQFGCRVIDASELAQIVKVVDQGILKPRFDQVLPLADAKRAQDLNQAGQSHGKIVLQVMT